MKHLQLTINFHLDTYITLIVDKYLQALTSDFCRCKNSQQEVLCKDTKACLEHMSSSHSNKVGWHVWMPAALASTKLHEWTRQPSQHKEDVLCRRRSSSFDGEMIYFKVAKQKKQRWKRNCWKQTWCPNHWYFIIVYKYNSQTNPELWVVFAQTSGLHCVDAEEGTLEVSAAGRHGHATAANGKRLIDRPRVCYEFVFASRPSLTLGCFCLNCLNLIWKSSSGYLVLMTICCLSSFFDSDVCRFVSSFVILHCHWKWPHVADAQALCAKEPTLKLRCFVVVLNHSARRQRSHKPQLCFNAVNAQQVKWHDQNLLKSCDTCHCTGYFLANYGLKHRCPQLWMGISLNLHHLPCHPHLPPYPAAFEGSCNTQGYDSPKHFENSKDPWATALQREQAPRSPGINWANTPLSHDAHGWSLSNELSK